MPRPKEIIATNGVTMVDSSTMREQLRIKYNLEYGDQYMRLLARSGKIPGVFIRQSWYFNVDEVAQALGAARLPAKKVAAPVAVVDIDDFI